MAEFGPSDGYATPAFEEPARTGRTRVQYGNDETPSRDDPLVHQLVERVSELVAHVDALEERVQALEGDLGDEPTEYDDEPPV